MKYSIRYSSNTGNPSLYRITPEGKVEYFGWITRRWEKSACSVETVSRNEPVTEEEAKKQFHDAF